MVKINLALRNKTKDILKRMLPEQRAAVLKRMESLVILPEEEAFREMVKLKIPTLDILSNNKKLEEIETLSRMCGDICINYKKVNPNSWLSDEDYPSYLIKEFGNDKTLLALIKRRVSRRLDSPKPLDIARLQFLLNSKEEKYRFGGLRELKFTNEEAQYFKNKTEVIAQYVCDIFSVKADVKVSVPEVSETEPTQEISETSIPEISEETESDPIAIPLHLSAANVIANADLIQSFLSAYDALDEQANKMEAAGFDLKAVITNAASVKQLLSAAANL